MAAAKLSGWGHWSWTQVKVVLWGGGSVRAHGRSRTSFICVSVDGLIALV